MTKTTLTTGCQHGLKTGDLITMNGRLRRIADSGATGSPTTLVIERLRWWRLPFFWVGRLRWKLSNLLDQIWDQVELAKGHMKKNKP